MPLVCQQRNSALGACLFDDALSLTCKSALPTDRNAIQMQSEHHAPYPRHENNQRLANRVSAPAHRKARSQLVRAHSRSHRYARMLMRAPISELLSPYDRALLAEGPAATRGPRSAPHARAAGKQ